MKNKTASKNGFFTFRVLIGVVLCFAGITIVLFALGPAAAGQPRTVSASANKIAPEVMADTDNGKSASVIILLADQANVSAGYDMRDQDARGWFVYNTLSQHTARTQSGIRSLLDSRGVTYQSFFVVNMIVANADRALVEVLAARPDVARVDSNRPTRWIEDPSIANFGVTPGNAVTVEWGVQDVNAPQVWAMGFTGQGIVIGNEDTGMRWTHVALKPHYRGWNGVTADHNYNWHDSIHDSVGNPCGNDSPFPCDDFFHGSHTTGTAIGDDGMGNQIGMAPGAKWIGCRNMDQGTGTPTRYIECMEWFLAPTQIGGGNPDPTKAPDITINSWECPASEGCSFDTLQAAVEAQAAAGIMMVSAAQNSGPSCSTVQNPPGIYAATYSVGALTTGTDTIASFSSRGPVTSDGSGRIKPDISAPGTGTRSCSNASDSAYTTASGTSMATPHISGAMALLWSAIPSLRHQITMSRDALDNTAVHIGSTQCGTA